MKVLVINSGSSSIKYQLFDMPEEKVICSGLIERIGLEEGAVHYESEENSIKETIQIENHKVGLEKVVSLLLDTKVGVISSTDEIEVVGHRVVHGGSSFTKTTEVTGEVKIEIESLFSLAPQHNPANLEGVNVAEAIFTKAKQVAVFDTAFHQTIPEKAFTYAIPKQFLTDNKIRLYGFHGTSHKYVSEKANAYLQTSNSKLITVHLGNGCSISAVENGQSIDHSLGFGPVTGLVMGTRSGDIDHTLIFYLVNTLGYDVNEVNTLLQKESGMFGLTGYSDLRDIEAEAEKGNVACQLALDINTYRIKKYIGSYIAAMNGVDAIVFTAGIGENSSLIREKVCTDLEFFGIEIDTNKNNIRAKKLTEIHSDNSKVKLLVIPTNEEVEIAKQSYGL
ncbi:acetate/propionate family kinase [uncultured Tenacibaculum sp.]|uniref:acetate/propionate family kinase n=1 Tax=uncultured Tenacibaculum sp. TaxID=174713 RepID=UPI00263221C0|nr:acetate kinase [uncultured Tenacibaculum sp.]